MPSLLPRRVVLPRRTALPLALCLLGACGEPARAALPVLRSTRIENMPHIEQRPDFCGEACAAMALRRLGHAWSQDDVFAATGVDPSLGRGAITAELARGLKQIGFEVGKVWYDVGRARTGATAAALDAQFEALHADLLAGIPSVVCTRFDESPGTSEHFRLVVGYEQKTDEVLYHDPASAKGAYLRMPRKKLLSLWPLKSGAGRAIAIRLPLKPGRIGAPAKGAVAPHTPAGYAQHVMQVRKQIRARLMRGTFSIIVQPPFVVVGDEWRGDVERRATGTVKWAVDLLKREFFPRDPKGIITIWLFKDAASYVQNTVKLTGSRPGTPYGFFSDDLQALLMDISTGGGTLVHEIVHPFMESNFPECPPWFNEGLGSLYEAVGERDGRLRGYTNWRLPSLQRAIRAGTVPSFATLMAQDARGFYQLDPGTNYAQSRYLLYFLQERGLLHTYYQRFRKDVRRDPTGLKTLKRALQIEDVGVFQRQWDAFVLKLRWAH